MDDQTLLESKTAVLRWCGEHATEIIPNEVAARLAARLQVDPIDLAHDLAHARVWEVVAGGFTLVA
jgi:hypothetical protein